jgi:hypothetical protein
MSNVTIDQAISRGTKLVNVPVWLFLCSPVILWLAGRHTIANLIGEKGATELARRR